MTDMRKELALGRGAARRPTGPGGSKAGAVSPRPPAQGRAVGVIAPPAASRYTPGQEGERPAEADLSCSREEGLERAGDPWAPCRELPAKLHPRCVASRRPPRSMQPLLA